MMDFMDRIGIGTPEEPSALDMFGDITLDGKPVDFFDPISLSMQTILAAITNVTDRDTLRHLAGYLDDALFLSPVGLWASTESGSQYTVSRERGLPTTSYYFEPEEGGISVEVQVEQIAARPAERIRYFEGVHITTSGDREAIVVFLQNLADELTPVED